MKILAVKAEVRSQSQMYNVGFSKTSMIGWCQVVRLQSTLAITTFDTTEVGTRKNEEPKKLFIACVYWRASLFNLLFIGGKEKIIQSLFEPLSLSLVGQRNSSDAKRWNVIRNSYVKILSRYKLCCIVLMTVDVFFLSWSGVTKSYWPYIITQ